jgi:hypothetical protein
MAIPSIGRGGLDDPEMSNIEGFLQLSPYVSVLSAAVTVLLDNMNLI